MTPTSLDRANARIRRGARQSSLLVSLLLISGVLYVVYRHPPFAVVMVSLLVALGVLLVVDIRRFSHLTFTREGIQLGRSRNGLRWDQIVQATYDVETGVRLRDALGNTAHFKLHWAIPADDILAAIKEHLPAGVVLEQPTWLRRLLP